MKVIAAILCNINVISLAGNGGNETTRCVYCNVNTKRQFVWEKKTFYVIPKGLHQSFYLLDLTRSKKFRFYHFCWIT